jgi:hypothetical protein
MDDLIVFLRARFDGDEWTARVVKDAALKRTHYRASMVADADCDLREVEAKRELVNRFEAMAAGVLVVTGVEPILSEYRRVILPALVAKYQDHPDYRPEWAPTA